MAPRFRSATFVVLAVLVTVCSLHIDHVDAVCRANRCPRRPNSTPTCTNGRCAIRCKTNYASCDKRDANGCEVNLLTNPNNCGKCNHKCPRYPNTVPTCTKGRCTPKCKPGYADCNRNMAKDGCETFVAGTDPRNCGKCGAQCKEDQYPFAVSKCTGGKCGILLCYRGMENCNGKVADGCERNIITNPNSCGSCGNVCPTYPNAVPLCANGFCRSVCQDGFDYCYGPEIDARGCSKFYFDQDANNCGGCNIVCDVGQSCQQGVCKS